MVTAQHIIGTAVFEQLSDAWRDLAPQGVTNTPFQTPEYNKIWFDHLGEGELHAVAVFDDGALIGVAPFNLRGETIVFNASKEESDYLDVIAAPQHIEVVWQKVFDCLCSSQAPAWATLDLYNIPDHSPSRHIIEALAAERGFSFAEEVAEVCPTISLGETFDDYLAGIDKKQAREIRRKFRRAAGAEATVRVVSKKDDLQQEVDDFLALLQKSTREKSDWLNPARTAVFHATAQAAMDNGTLQLMFIEVDGQKAAALFNFNYNGRTWVYNSGLDPAAFGKLSLGVVLSARAIELAVENGNKEFDFLRGNEEYKYRFGAEDRVIYRLVVSRDS